MEIGGYFELQLPEKESYYPDLIPLNSGRNCLEYILRAGSFTKIFLPWYICEVVLEPIHELGINVDFYSINEDLTIKELDSIAGFSGNIVLGSSNPDGIPKELLYISKLKQSGFKPGYTLEEGIKSVYSAYAER